MASSKRKGDSMPPRKKSSTEVLDALHEVTGTRTRNHTSRKSKTGLFDRPSEDLVTYEKVRFVETFLGKDVRRACEIADIRPREYYKWLDSLGTGASLSCFSETKPRGRPRVLPDEDKKNIQFIINTAHLTDTRRIAEIIKELTGQKLTDKQILSQFKVPKE